MGFFPDAQAACCERLGFRIAAEIRVEKSEIVERARKRRIVRSARLLANRNRPLDQGLRLAVPALVAVDVAKLIKTIGQI